MDYIWIAIIAVIVLIFISMAIKIIPKNEQVVIFRLGRGVGTVGPGLIIIIPFIDRIVKEK
jgi:regulator of protease activity HflC (stomatin/prohibitin superfamily)